MQMWHHQIHNDFLIQELTLKDFKDINENKSVFITAYMWVVNDIFTEEMQILFKEFNDFSNLFFLNREDLLSQHSSYNHNIVLEKSKKPSFEPLYNLLEKELKVLKEYIEQILNKEWICHLTNPAEASILFILKQDRFYNCVLIIEHWIIL